MKNVPTVDDSQFKGMKLGEIKQYVKTYYETNLKGKSVTNQNKGITVILSREGLHHVLYARRLGYIKAKALIVIDKMIKEAVYCNFKNADANDPVHVVGS